MPQRGPLIAVFHPHSRLHKIPPTIAVNSSTAAGGSHCIIRGSGRQTVGARCGFRSAVPVFECYPVAKRTAGAGGGPASWLKPAGGPVQGTSLALRRRLRSGCSHDSNVGDC